MARFVHCSQPVTDIARQVLEFVGAEDEQKCEKERDGDRSLRLLRETLMWGHLCPTAPDTLPCHPFSNGDPFILSETPDLLFAGNQPAFATDLYYSSPDSAASSLAKSKPVRLVCVPAFVHSGLAVLVDIAHPELPCSLLEFV